jgi:DNA-directed RNA polymerase subunit RPC12/RpoP
MDERMSVTVYHCSECAAPIRIGQERCDYCGFWFKPRPQAVSDIVLEAIKREPLELYSRSPSSSFEWWILPLALGVAFVGFGVLTGWPAWMFVFFSTLVFLIYAIQLARGLGSMV